MSGPVCFFVPGVPQPGGSKRGIAVKTKTGKIRAVVVEDAKHNAPWRAVVSLAASEHFAEPLRGAISFSFSFVMPRPKHHYGSGRNAERLKPDAPHVHTIPPDVTKLIRSTEDALKGIAWLDDCQVVSQAAGKMYGPRPGCWIRIEPFEEGGDALWPRSDSARSAGRSTAEPFASDDAPAATGAMIESPVQAAAKQALRFRYDEWWDRQKDAGDIFGSAEPPEEP